MIAWPLVLVKIPRGNWKDGKKGSPRHSWLLLLSNDAKRRERDRLGLRGEENRLGKGRRAQRCIHTQILSSGTQRAKENGAEGMGETGGKRVADAMIEAQGAGPHAPVRHAVSGAAAPYPLSRDGTKGLSFYTYCMVLRNFFGGKHLRV